MTKTQTNFRLSVDTRTKLDQIAIAKRKETGMETAKVQIVADLIDAAHAQLKRVEPIKDRNRTVGWQAFYGDHYVGTFDGAGSKPEAERALDAYVFEELSK